MEAYHGGASRAGGLILFFLFQLLICTYNMSHFVQINHHVVLTDREQEAAVNALAYFHWIFNSDFAKSRMTAEEIAQEHEHWKDVAKEYESNFMDILASKIATSN